MLPEWLWNTIKEASLCFVFIVVIQTIAPIWHKYTYKKLLAKASEEVMNIRYPRRYHGERWYWTGTEMQLGFKRNWFNPLEW